MATDSSPPSEAEVALITRAVTQLARKLRSKRPKASVTVAAVGLLATLHQRGPMPAVELARFQNLKPQSVSRLIARLDQDGLIQREPDPKDQRALLISITDTGRRALKHDMQARREWLGGAIAEALSPAERRTLAEAALYMLRIVDAEGA
jgi:DNA-binding MarR family transcriptional regulator